MGSYREFALGQREGSAKRLRTKARRCASCESCPGGNYPWHPQRDKEVVNCLIGLIGRFVIGAPPTVQWVPDFPPPTVGQTA